MQYRHSIGQWSDWWPFCPSSSAMLPNLNDGATVLVVCGGEVEKARRRVPPHFHTLVIRTTSTYDQVRTYVNAYPEIFDFDWRQA